MEPSQPIAFEDVLKAEYGVLRPGADFNTADRWKLYHSAHGQARPFSALCISAGGIRSATFSLGAIQGLAEKGLLEQFDYLSTVSGAGYIGGWLTAWINRVKGLERVAPYLRRNAPPPVEGEADPIQHLREYNNSRPNLAHFPGTRGRWRRLLSGMYFLNWLVLIPLLMFGLMAPRLVLSILRYGELFQRNSRFGGTGSLVICRGRVTALDGRLAVHAEPLQHSAVSSRRRERRHTVSDFTWYVLGPLVMASVAFCAYDSLYFSVRRTCNPDL